MKPLRSGKLMPKFGAIGLGVAGGTLAMLPLFTSTQVSILEGGLSFMAGAVLFCGSLLFLTRLAASRNWLALFVGLAMAILSFFLAPHNKSIFDDDPSIGGQVGQGIHVMFECFSWALCGFLISLRLIAYHTLTRIFCLMTGGILLLAGYFMTHDSSMTMAGFLLLVAAVVGNWPWIGACMENSLPDNACHLSSEEQALAINSVSPSEEYRDRRSV
ncbi:MAG: hypothetical protein QM758_01420 [Armatimonas sp.]